MIVIWRDLIEIPKKILIEHILCHLLNKLCVLMHQLILVLDFDLFHLILPIDLHLPLTLLFN